ncbi:MAG: 16S rRNA (guanine(966)-N(2))-methyltransferase RsmD [Kiritimatiellae bacterium]|jgi:16S rRNA (guanine966-N2)-methyltransferase|nr:16S rRNA (guanine(966)-N(2))-methyltransferase RsmD [Kiritimatiellia bacterium]
MRITGGEFCGRKLKVPAGDKVRPTQDRVREALFSILMKEIYGACFIDLYAGSGAVGLEAYSRGAEHVVWLEKNSRHLKVLRQNVDALAPERGEIVCGDVERWLKTAGQGRAADIAFADPPYREAKERGFTVLLELAAGNNVVAEGGIFVAELPVACKADEIDGWELLRDREYGHTRLAVYRRGKKCESARVLKC